MGHSLKGTTLRARSRGRGSLHGLMGAHIVETFMRIIYMGEAFTSGQMEGFIMAHGSVTKCMVMGSLLGQMVVDMKASTLTTKSRAGVSSNGQTTASTSVAG